MDKTEAILISLAFSVLAVRLYQKYIKKNQGKPGSFTKTGSSFSSLKDDDYEPYSKK